MTCKEMSIMCTHPENVIRKMKNYGWDAVKLSDAYSLEELTQLRDSITDDPANLNPEKGSIYIYTKVAHKKLDQISWAVFHKIKENSHEASRGVADSATTVADLKTA